MSIFGEQYRLRTDENGLAVIEVSGKCTDDERADLEADATRKYQMIPIPNANGAILKSTDGTQPAIIEVEPSTMPGASFSCVKVDARVNPFSYLQVGGPFDGSYVNDFVIVYQQVGGVS